MGKSVPNETYLLIFIDFIIKSVYVLVVFYTQESGTCVSDTGMLV